MNKTYPLSELSKARLRRNNLISLALVLLTIATAAITSNWWMIIATVYFLAKFYFRLRILIIADPHLVFSDEGLLHRWSREVFIPWTAIENVDDTSKHIITVRYKDEGSDKTKFKWLYKWRVEIDPNDLIAQIKASAQDAQSKDPATFP